MSDSLENKRQEPPQSEALGEFDAYNFPEEFMGHPALSWMGANYVEYAARALQSELRRQDPGATILAIKCEEPPDLETTVSQETRAVTSVKLSMRLQILAKSGDATHWRLRGAAAFYRSLRNGSGSTSFEIASAERV